MGNSEAILFEPDHLNANIGDRITFHFRTLNHTLTQSTLHDPCLVTHQFDASFHQFNPTEGHELMLTLTVDSVDPRWYFCKQTHPVSHCHVGMIFAINPGEHMGEFRKNTRKASSLSGYAPPTGLLPPIALPAPSTPTSILQSAMTTTRIISKSCKPTSL